MLNLKALRQRHSDLRAAVLAIFEAAEKDSNRDLSAEEMAKVKELQGKIDLVAEQLTLAERHNESERAVPAAHEDAPAPAERSEDRIQVREPLRDELFGRARGWRETLAQLNRPSGAWKSFGDFLGAVAGASTPGSRVDPRLYQAAAAGASESIPSDGGFLVRKDYSTILLDRAMETSKLAQLCFHLPIGPDSDGVEMPIVDETSRATGSRWGGVRVFRRAEADTVTATKPALAMKELRLEDMMALAYATNRLLRDATTMAALFAKGFESEFAFKLDDEIIRGTGVGQCLGILNAPATIKVAKEGAQVAATIVYNNIVNMWARAKGLPVWYCNSEVLPALTKMTLPIGTAGAAGFMPPGGLSVSPYATLMGRPLIPIEQCEALGTIGDLILADLSDYMIIEKGGIESAESMHVRFTTGENTFRWMYRVNGMPMTHVAKTPYKGSNSVSPYVVLNTRA